MYDGPGPGRKGRNGDVDADDGTGSFRSRRFLSCARLSRSFPFFRRPWTDGGAIADNSRGRCLPEKNCTLGWRGNCEAYATCLQ